MKAKIAIQQVMNSEPGVFPDAGSNESYKTCPYCGQSYVPFKKGVCICGKQVGDITYVNDPTKFAMCQYYSYIGIPRVEKLGIAELADN